MTQMHRLFFYGSHLTLHIRRILVLRTMSQKKVGSRAFLSTLLSFDQIDRIYHIVWTRFPHEIRLILENPYVFGPFWNYQNGIEGR